MGTPIETYRGAVYPWEHDIMEHMNVRFYVAKFDEGTWHLFGKLGMTAGYFRDNQRTMGAVQQNLTYRRELFAGDLIVVRTEVLEITERKLHFIHRMHDVADDEVVASGDMIGVHIDRKTHKATPFPEDILAAGRELAK